MKAVRPDEPPPLMPAERLAYAAFFRGEASESQQRIVARHLLQSVCGVMATERAAMTEGERAFIAGRRWVGVVAALYGGVHLLGFPVQHQQSTDIDYGDAHD